MLEFITIGFRVVPIITILKSSISVLLHQVWRFQMLQIALLPTLRGVDADGCTHKQNDPSVWLSESWDLMQERSRLAGENKTHTIVHIIFFSGNAFISSLVLQSRFQLLSLINMVSPALKNGQLYLLNIKSCWNLKDIDSMNIYDPCRQREPSPLL